MKVHNSVPSVLHNVELPPAVTAYLNTNNDEGSDVNCVIGGILQDTRHAWLSNGSKFTVININTGQKIAAWTFGAALRDFKPKITCVYELPIPLIEHTIQLLIGLECDLIGGMVCLFHCNGSRVLRAIQVDCQVICIKYIENLPGSPLNCFDGAILIGTHGGATFILDLNRQKCTEAIADHNDIIVKDELNIANLMVLSIDNIDLIVEQRAIACRKDHHIAIQINEGCIHNLQFILHNPDNTIKLEVERENVYVTSVLYVPQLASVVIGLNIGAFQLWNLLTLRLEYTSQINADGLPVTHIAFLEPCDDPRAFCYIWVVHSVIDRHEDGFPLAVMYSLTYQEKQVINEQQCLYQHFLSCNSRFNLELTNIDGTNNFTRNFSGGRCISCQSLVKAPNKDDADEYVLNICQIVWECWTVSTISPVQSNMILFDIDQWYKEHMPDCSTLQTNNYMSVINLGDTLSNAVTSYLCDVKINSDTLTSYFSVQRLEEHFFPNALGYECFCLTNTDITKLLTMGVQRQILASINERGPPILLHPTNIFQQCINCGLIPLYVEPYHNSTPEPVQRQMLLSIALEARLIQFLGKCACDWATGSHTSVGCTLQLLLDWSWNRALSLKQNGDRVTVPFFNHSGEAPDRNTIQQLDNCVRQLGHIASLYSIILDKCASYILPDKIKEIKQRQKVIQIVAQYFQVIQWFLNVGLLPEFNVEQLTDNINDRLPYPIDSLLEFYQNRRLKLHCLNGENPANENLENKNCELLFIDQFIKLECPEKKLNNMWIEDYSTINGLYPPPSLHSLLKIYLIPEIKEEHKHSLVLYTLIDYAMVFDSERYENVIKRLMQFPTMFGLSNTAIKVTQAFWHLDHRYFQLALNELQCVLAGDCLSQWQHNVVLSSLLVQKKPQSALQYLHVRKPCASNEIDNKIYDDWEACSNLYLSRGLVYEAFNLNKDATKDFSAVERENRLKVFFNGCKRMALLPKVLLLPLSKFEENIFVKFLKTVGDSYSSDILVMYYLYRSRYIEAQKVNDELKRLTVKSQLPYDVTNDFSMGKEHIYKTEARDQLVDLYCKTLPPITRQLANFTTNLNVNQKGSLPVPMTVNVQANTPKPALYKSTLIQTTIDKASETWMDKPCVKRGLKRLYQVEETPFICTPKLTKPVRTFEEKMSTTPDETPSKKLKLNDSDNEKSYSKTLETVNPKLTNEIEVLLHTPTVKRKSKWNPESISSLCSIERIPSQRESTPQSILKVRKLRNYCNSSPMYDRYFAETDDELETASQYTQSDNLSRSIRFKIPSRTHSPSPSSEYMSDMNDSYSDLCSFDIDKNKDAKKYTSPQNISSRKSIHHLCVDNIHSKETSSSRSPEKTLSSIPDPMKSISSDSIDGDDDFSVQQSVDTNSSSTNINDTIINVESNVPYVINSPKPRRSLRLSAIQDITTSQHGNSPVHGRYSLTPASKTSISQSVSLKFTSVSRMERSITKKILSSDKLDSSTFYKLSSDTDENDKESEFSKDITISDDVNNEIIHNKSKDLHLQNSSSSRIINVSFLPSDTSEELITDSSFQSIIDDPNNVPERSMNIVNKTDELSKNVTLHPIETNDESVIVETNKELVIIETNDKLEVVEANDELEVVEANDELEVVEANDELEVVEANDELEAVETDDELKIVETDNGSENTLYLSKNIEVVSKSEIEKPNENNSKLQTDITVNTSIQVESKNASQLNITEDVAENILNTEEQIVNPDVILSSENEATVYEEIEIESPNFEIHSNPVSSKNDSNSNTSCQPSLPCSANSTSENVANKCCLDDTNLALEVSSLEYNKSHESLSVPADPDIVVTKHDVDIKLNKSNVTIVKEDETATPILEIDESSKSLDSVNFEKEKTLPISVPEPEGDVSNDRVSAKSPSRKRQLSSSMSSQNETTPSKYRTRAGNKSSVSTNDSLNKNISSSVSDSLEIDIVTIKTPRSYAKQSKSSRVSTDSDNDSIISNQSSRRSTRSTSQLNASFVSQSSVDSDQESVSSQKKSRRSILAAIKPNLSVIPEISHAESDKSSLNMSKTNRRNEITSSLIDIDSYSSSRRLTRHQKSLLEKSIENSSFVMKDNPKNITHESLDVIKESTKIDESESDSEQSNYTSETLDPILLLDKNDFKGSPDPEENIKDVYAFSRESSIVSNRLDLESGSQTKETTPDSVRSKPSRRSSRLLSESRDSPSKSTPKASNILNESAVESPSVRIRRQSFQIAKEALSTPRKNRRLSTDSKKSEINVSIAEVETLPKNVNEKEKDEVPIVDTQSTLPSTSKDIKNPSPTPKRAKRSKAASIHGVSTISNIDTVSTPANKLRPRKSLFFTPLGKEDEQHSTEKKQKPRYKRKTGVHKVIQPMEFVLEKE